MKRWQMYTALGTLSVVGLFLAGALAFAPNLLLTVPYVCRLRLERAVALDLNALAEERNKPWWQGLQTMTT